MGESRIRAIVIALGVVVLAVVAFVLWRGTGVPNPTIPPGQSLANPFGSAGTAASQQGKPAQIPQGMPGMPTNVPAGIPPGMGSGPAGQR